VSFASKVLAGFAKFSHVVFLVFSCGSESSTEKGGVFGHAVTCATEAGAPRAQVCLLEPP
jgi:hypothetical protein